MSSMDFIKTAYTVLKEANRLDLAEEIMNLREEMLTLREDNLQFTTENASLKDQLELKAKIIWDNGLYWIIDDEYTKDKRKTPICPACYDQDKRVSRITSPQASFPDGHSSHCIKHGVITLP